MKHRINVSLALILSCVLAGSPSLVFAASDSTRTAISRKMDRLRLPKPERLRLNKPFQAPEGQTSTLLSDGRLLVVGGIGVEGTLSTAVINDPLTGERVPLPNLGEARAWHSATVLPDGRVFIFGGTGTGGRALRSAEIFDPVTLSFTLLSSVGLTARASHSATLLMDGKVLLVGGVGENGKAATKVETWDFQTKTATTLAARLNVTRQKHKARLLADGRVLIESGIDEVGSQVGVVEAFSPETKEFTLAGSVSEVSNSAPVLVASVPENDAVDVPLDSLIALRFSKLLAPRTVNPETVELSSPEGRTFAKVVATENGRLVFVSPFERLEPNTSYTLTINSANDGVSDVVPASITFTTAQGPQDKPDTTDQPDWIPDANALRGDWTSKSPRSPWQDLPSLEAEAGVTALSGQTLTLRGQPLANVTLEINGTKTTTDSSGRFLLKSLNAGHQVLKIDGGTANRPGGTYGIFRAGVEITEGKTNALSYTIWMPRLDMANASRISAPTTTDVSITTPRIPGLELRLPSQTLIRDLDGQPVTQLSITPIPTDRPPFPLPEGIHVPVFFTIQPGGSRIIPPRARLIYPNFTTSLPGTRIDFWNYDPEGKGWYVYGQGTVTPDGSQIMPDPGVVLYEFSGTMVALPNFSAAEGPYPCNPEPVSGDPVDTSTGLFVYRKTDFSIPDSLGIKLTRTYRQKDTIARPFGIGATHTYEIYLVGATWPYTFIDLVLPDGGKVHFDRVSPGTSFSDAIYEHTGPSTFNKARIRWIGGWEVKLRDGTIYTFPDGENQVVPRKAALIGTRDRYGNALTLTRNTDGDLTKITSPNGRWLEFTYDTSHRITKAKDNIGREILYAYDASGRLQQVTELNLGTTKYTYDTSHRMLTIEDPRGIVYLTNQYDANGRVMKQTMADDTPGNPNDNPTHQFSYVLDGSGKVTQSDYTDPRGFVRRTTLNASGYATSVTYGLGTAEEGTITYERQAGTNRLASITDDRGRQTTFTYDSSGNVISMTKLAGTPDALTTTYQYEPLFNQLAQMVDPLGRHYTFSYDATGNLTSATDDQGKFLSMTYNSAGQPLTAKDQLQRTTNFEYEAGQLRKVIDPLGHTVTRFNDGVGRLLSLTDQVGKVTRFEYDASSNVKKMIDSLNGTTELTYDLNNHITQVKDPRNKIITFTYDNLDRQLTRTDALQGASSVQLYEYDKANNLTKYTDRRGKVTVFNYDALGRKTFAGFGAVGGIYESTITYGYDNGNRLRSVVDSLSGTITIDVDELDNTTSIAAPQGTITYTYDDVGRRESMSVPGQASVLYGYDDRDHVTSITRGTDVVTFAYDGADQLIRTTQPNGLVTDYAYDLSSRLSSIVYKQGSTVLGDLTYEYDAAGRQVGVDGTFARSDLPTAVASATYNDANRLTQKGATTYSYDANGNLTGDGTNTYNWDARNQLTSMSGPGLSATFQYDGLGRRINKTVNSVSTSYLYDGYNVVQELSGATPTANLLTGGLDRTFARTDSSQTLAVLRDGAGSTLGLADGTGTVQTSYTYDPFGQTSATGTSNSNSSQYTGRENDGTGLYYYRARYYSPSLARFISEDPIDVIGGINLYVYVANDPMNYGDPFGLEKAKQEARTEQDRRVLDFLVRYLGGTMVEGGEVHNPRGILSYEQAAKRLTDMGFEPYFDPHPDHAGGWDYEMKICGIWYHVTLGYPKMQMGGYYWPGDPWTFLQFHRHGDWAPHNHWLEMIMKSPRIII